jgi:hypothetical protein
MLRLGLSAAGARGRSHRAKLGLEILETRELLSHAQTSISDALSPAGGEGAVANRAALPNQQSLDRHSLIATTVGGPVQRPSAINPLYTGPKRPDLRVLGTHAQFFFPRGFAFTGTTVGFINHSQSSVYVFGVNRGGATAPGPFPGRPQIVFDAEIIVATNPNGFTGTVERLNSQGQVTSSASLLNNQISFSRNRVQAVVPAALLAPTSPPGTADPQDRFSYTFWAGVSPSALTGIAGFVPELGNRRVRVTTRAFPSS